jgi:hypothetical protein
MIAEGWEPPRIMRGWSSYALLLWASPTGMTGRIEVESG